MPLVKQPLEIGFTGTRFGMKRVQASRVHDLVVKLNPDIGHHGCCYGSDAEFHRLLIELGIAAHGHPPLKEIKMAKLTGYAVLAEPKEYIDRNHDIVDASSLLIVAPNTLYEVKRSGTWATYRYARKQGKLIYQVTPDGRVVVEQPS